MLYQSEVTKSKRTRIPAATQTLGVGFEESHVLAFGTHGTNGGSAFNPMGGGGADNDDEYDNDDGGGYDDGFDDNSFDTVRGPVTIAQY